MTGDILPAGLTRALFHALPTCTWRVQRSRLQASGITAAAQLCSACAGFVTRIQWQGIFLAG